MRSPSLATPAFDEKPPPSNSQVPIAERLRATDSRRERSRARGTIVELRDSTRDGECELRSGAESRVLGNRVPDDDPGAVAYSLRLEIPAREVGCAIRFCTLGLYTRGALDLDHQRRIEHAGADATEATAERAAQIEHAEVQSRGSLDANDAISHQRLASQRSRPACSRCDR